MPKKIGIIESTRFTTAEDIGAMVNAIESNEKYNATVDLGEGKIYVKKRVAFTTKPKKKEGSE